MAGTGGNDGAGVVVRNEGPARRRGRPRTVQQPSVEAASNTGDEGSAAREGPIVNEGNAGGGGPVNNEGVQLSPAVQAAIAQAVVVEVQNLNADKSAEKSGEKSKKNEEREGEASSVVKSVKADVTPSKSTNGVLPSEGVN